MQTPGWAGIMTAGHGHGAATGATQGRAVIARRGAATLALVAAVLLAEALAVLAVYPGTPVFDWRAQVPAAVAVLVGSADVHGFLMAVAVCIVFAARPTARAALLGGLRPAPAASWIGLTVAGAGVLLAPGLLVPADADRAVVLAAILCWLLGGAAIVVGAVFAAAPPQAWRSMARAAGPGLWIVLGLAAVAPSVAYGVQTAWRWTPLATLTFNATAALLNLIGQPVWTAPERFEIAVGDFHIAVGEYCSGIEGIGLITTFTLCYFVLFRDRLRFPHALALIPIAMAASWLLNVLRIAALTLIGAHVSPQLAQDGFHSNAGWLFFTALALALMALADAAPIFRRPDASPGRAAPPLSQDVVAAQLLPFVVFMLSAMIVAAASTTPDLLYPARIAATVAALWFFRRLYLRLDWRIDRVALAAGAAGGVVWVATSPTDAAPLSAAVAGLTGWAFALWAATRVLGTALVVPLVEELAFRGYAMPRLDFGGVVGRAVAVTASAGMFALLHDRWIEGFAAGVVFGLLALRRGGVVPAIQAHAAANALIAAWAVATGEWGAI